MAPDYPYSLVSRELRGIIRGLLTKAEGSVELFFDHCLFTMLQELDKTPGKSALGTVAILRAHCFFSCFQHDHQFPFQQEMY